MSGCQAWPSRPCVEMAQTWPSRIEPGYRVVALASCGGQLSEWSACLLELSGLKELS